MLCAQNECKAHSVLELFIPITYRKELIITELQCLFEMSVAHTITNAPAPPLAV